MRLVFTAGRRSSVQGGIGAPVGGLGGSCLPATPV